MTIGVLDNNPALCQALETTLTFAGYEVTAHTDPLAFFEAIQHHSTDNLKCIIVDFRLPGAHTGIDIIAQVRKAHPFLPALLISGDPVSQSALRGLPNTAFCRKPFTLSTLLTALDSIQPDMGDVRPHPYMSQTLRSAGSRFGFRRFKHS